jgi:hypothetical protein
MGLMKRLYSYGTYLVINDGYLQTELVVTPKPTKVSTQLQSVPRKLILGTKRMYTISGNIFSKKIRRMYCTKNWYTVTPYTQLELIY